MGQKIYRIWWK